ncbi:hypothetical protein J0X19_02100 [Hymenobacter sp. BT186]|uniref:Uncharacterized protein n=1 Tax=Hymenobacter telluris TaxID=2816474 RepID=A0A939JBX7_9BACT|nr:hypothetical protein [Hymenobacter telluris]MBO0356727.1 hypothetical protein [Hymenobacter telluris]MBW3372752.1 hypothetical protein [Hymenobacter norwichensis]
MLLLAVGLALSLGLNGLLLTSRLEFFPAEHIEELAEATADLHLTQQQLAHCQIQQQQQDSLLLILRHQERSQVLADR